MKVIAIFAIFALCSGALVEEKDRTITKVVKLLQEMLEKSQKEGDEERVIYAKFKCYCDHSEAEKKASIKSLTEQIGILENKIAEIQGVTGTLSSECADLKDRMAKNEQAQEEATAIREKENKAYLAEKLDLEEAIASMKEAIKVLSEVGADQTMKEGADHKQFMAGYKASFAQTQKAQENVKSALNVASALMSSAQQKKTAAFLQAPFTGTYTSQSAEVLGILKNMRDTFEKNLADAKATEKAAQEAYDKLMEVLKEAFTTMSNSYDAKQEELGSNDEDLATKKAQLSECQKQLASDTEFLEKLIPMCKEKGADYDKRKVMRANEEAAIAEAISILNSDSAFATFGKTDATSTGGGALKFLQLRSVRRHMTSVDQIRHSVQSILQKAEKQTKSQRLTKVLGMVKAENPFTTVLDEIDKMLVLIAEEAKTDKENLDWCNSERTENDANLKEKKKDIAAHEKTIDELDTTINDPETGLLAQISATEQSLVENKEAQTTETAERTENNVAYQKDIANLVSAEGILEKAIKVLKAYYDDLAKKLADGEALLQKEEPAPPETWDAYEGQSSQGDKVIGQLEFILEETKKEETEAHQEEEDAQASYEDSMGTLKKQEAESEKQLANLQEELAEKQKDLLQEKEDLAATIKDKEAIEAYLAKIKPGCDFITANFELRETNRATEKEALEKAIKLIKATPAYKAAVTHATEESYGKCKEICVENGRDHAYCEACLADVTVVAYCADHDATDCDKAGSYDPFWMKHDSSTG